MGADPPRASFRLVDEALDGPLPAPALADVELAPEIEYPPDSLSGVVRRGAGLAGAGYVISQILTFASYLVLARLLTPAEIGVFAAGSVVVGVGMVLGDSGMEAALIQRRDRLEAAANTAFLVLLAGGVGLSLLALAAAPLVTIIFSSHEAGAVAAVMSGWMLLRLMTIVPDSLLQRRFSFMRRVVVDPLSKVAFAAGAIPAAALGMGVWSMVIGTYASISFAVIASWGFAGFVPSPRMADMRLWRELARFGRPVVGGNMIRRVVLEIPVLAIGPVKGTAALGQFNYAFRAASQPLGAVVNVGGYVLLPAFSRLSADTERFRAAVLKALRWLCILSFPAGMLMIPLGRPAVILGFGEQWREAGDAAMVLGVYCVALSLDSIASEAWKAVARTDMLPRMHGLSLVLTALFVGALVEPFGLIGVTVGMSVAAVGVAAYATRGMSRVLGIPLADLLREMWPPALAATLMAVGLYCLQRWVVRAEQHGIALGIALVAAEAILGVALYALIMSRTAPGPTQDVLRAARALPARLRARREGARVPGAA